MIDLVRSRLAKGERIAVLFPQQRQVFGYAKGLKEAGIDVENPKELDFNSDKPKLMPYHSAKGLTFDTVIMPRLVESAFGKKMSPERITRVMFVGITRATKWVCLCTTGESRIVALDRLIAGAEAGFLTIREPGESARDESPPKPAVPPEDDALDLL